MSEAAEAEPSASYLGTRPRAWGNEEVGDVLEEDEQLFRAALFALKSKSVLEIYLVKFDL